MTAPKMTVKAKNPQSKAPKIGPEPGSDRVLVGAVSGAHGIHGVLRIKSFTTVPGDIGTYGPLEDEAGEPRPIKLTGGSAAGAILARLPGVEDRSAAEALKGTGLYVPRSALPATEEDEWYYADLIGLDAIDPQGAHLGTVLAVVDHGAGEVIEIDLLGGGTLLLPFTHDAVPRVDIPGSRILVTPPPETEPVGERSGKQAEENDG